MPRIIETTVYEINELPEAAKARAREWYIHNVLNNDTHWYEVVFHDFQTIGGILGITLRTHPETTGAQGQTTPGRLCIWFRGFDQQGDGASFEGEWKDGTDGCRRIRQHAPRDKKLHEIADALAAAQRPNFYELAATITHQGRESHEYSMRIEIDRNGDAGREPTEGSAEAVKEALRNLARWLYRQLEAEYDNETSDSVVDKAIEANDVPFTANGEAFAI